MSSINHLSTSPAFSSSTGAAFLAAACAMFGLALPARAATMSASATPPPVNGLDIANYGAVTAILFVEARVIQN